MPTFNYSFLLTIVGGRNIYDNSLGRRLEYSASNLQMSSSNFLGDHSPCDYKPKTSPTSQHAFQSAYTKELLGKWVGRVGSLYIYHLFLPPELIISRLVMKIPVGWFIQSTDIQICSVHHHFLFIYLCFILQTLTHFMSSTSTKIKYLQKM